jgi:hypothetical protein
MPKLQQQILMMTRLPKPMISIFQRLLLIGQLCFAFSLILWYISQPFMGEYFALRSRMLLYEYVLGTSKMLGAKQGWEERQTQRFKQLSENEQLLLKTDYHLLQIYAQRPFLQKLQDGIFTLVRNIPPFEQAWIFFSVIIAILILLKAEGAKQAAWLLPLIVLAYALDNQLTGKIAPLSPDFSLFPTEERMIQHYLDEPLALSLWDQKGQLEKGWKRYLLENWSPNQKGSESERLEEAEFQLTRARFSCGILSLLGL